MPTERTEDPRGDPTLRRVQTFVGQVPRKFGAGAQRAAFMVVDARRMDQVVQGWCVFPPPDRALSGVESPVRV